MENREQELNFQSIIEASPIALLLTSTSGKIIYLNSFTANMFGYKKKELEGKGLDILLNDLHAQFPAGFWNNDLADSGAVNFIEGRIFQPVPNPAKPFRLKSQCQV